MDESAVELLAEKGYDPAFGARPLKRTIQSMLQNAVADRILDGKPGENTRNWRHSRTERRSKWSGRR